MTKWTRIFWRAMSCSSMDYTAFLSWIRQNTALLEYFHEEVCPLQWLTYPTLKRISMKQATTPRQDPILTHVDTDSHLMVSPPNPHQSVTYGTDRSMCYMMGEDKAAAAAALSTIQRKKEAKCRFTLCCFRCKRSKRSKEKYYPFEKYGKWIGLKLK